MSQSLDALLREAVAHHQSGRLAEAQATYEQILRADERNPNALNLLGMVHHARGRFEHAAELVARAIDAAPRAAGFHNNLGIVRLAQRRYESAEEALRQAIAIQPNYLEAINNLGVALTGQGKLDDAIQALLRAIELKHAYPSARNNLGNALRAKRMNREAIACYKDAIAFKADHDEAWANLGIAHLELGELKEAESACQRAIALKPNHVGAHYTLGLALEEAGRRDEAVAAYQRVLAERPGARGLRFHLAALTGQGREQFKAAPAEYVVSVFDHYADTFDRHLVGTLNYRAPGLIRNAIAAAGVTGPVDIVDLGCGTGLCGELLKPMARRMVGVDLSPRMIHQARERGIYDELFVEELAGFLAARFSQYELAAAADVLNYFGELESVLSAASQAMKQGGIFAFTLEKHDGAGYVLGTVRRFAHSIGYVRSLLELTGFEEVSAQQETLRTEGGRDVTGWVIVLRKV